MTTSVPVIRADMFGYASNETPEFMPMTHVLATRLCQDDRGQEQEHPFLDAPRRQDPGDRRVQERQRHPLSPLRVHTVVISVQHSEDVTNDEIRKGLMEEVIKPGIPAHLLDDKTIYHLNPSGRFVIGGPQGDAGVTGRKIIIDTYGGWGAHGGGAFSGKDPSKVDRSAA